MCVSTLQEIFVPFLMDGVGSNVSSMQQAEALVGASVEGALKLASERTKQAEENRLAEIKAKEEDIARIAAEAKAAEQAAAAAQAAAESKAEAAAA